VTYALCLDYEREVPALRRIIDTSIKTQWTLADIDFEQKLSSDHYIRILEWQGALRSTYVRRLSDKKKEQLSRQFVAFDFSQILHGEQSAMMLAAQLVNCVEDLDAKIYASTQVKDEARHVETIRKVIRRIGPIYDVGPHLRQTIDHLINCHLWPKQVLGLQLFLEARALLSFRQHLLFVNDPVFMDSIQNIERDESQHVAFGIQYIARGIEAMTPEQREELVTYGVWLDRNIWSMTKSAEYRAIFEECDLDFDEFEAGYEKMSFLRPSTQGTAQSMKSIDAMHDTFHRWFYTALHRVGLSEVIERRLGRKLNEAEMADSKAIAPGALPWINHDYSVMRPTEGAERVTIKKLHAAPSRKKAPPAKKKR